MLLRIVNNADRDHLVSVDPLGVHQVIQADEQLDLTTALGPTGWLELDLTASCVFINLIGALDTRLVLSPRGTGTTDDQPAAQSAPSQTSARSPATLPESVTAWVREVPSGGWSALIGWEHPLRLDTSEPPELPARGQRLAAWEPPPVTGVATLTLTNTEYVLRPDSRYLHSRFL